MLKLEPIAFIRTEFSEKFGIPRQSGLVGDLKGQIVFEPPYRNPDMLRGLDGFSHIWLIWEFSANRRSSQHWQATVRPPRLGGNSSMGVLATRSPFRPNPLGLSCVKLESIMNDPSEGPVLIVRGADLMDMTPIYDIKPYIIYSDSHPEASQGFVDNMTDSALEVIIPEDMKNHIADEDSYKALVDTLSLDPRPAYHNDPEREYGMMFSGMNIRFNVCGNRLTVTAIEDYRE